MKKFYFLVFILASGCFCAAAQESNKASYSQWDIADWLHIIPNGHLKNHFINLNGYSMRFYWRKPNSRFFNGFCFDGTGGKARFTGPPFKLRTNQLNPETAFIYSEMYHIGYCGKIYLLKPYHRISPFIEYAAGLTYWQVDLTTWLDKQPMIYREGFTSEWAPNLFYGGGLNITPFRNKTCAATITLFYGRVLGGDITYTDIQTLKRKEDRLNLSEWRLGITFIHK